MAISNAPREHDFRTAQSFLGEALLLVVGENTHSDAAIAAQHREAQTCQVAMERYSAAILLRQCFDHSSSAAVTYVDVCQEILSRRKESVSIRGKVILINEKQVYIEHNGSIFSCHESCSRPYVNKIMPIAPTPSLVAPKNPINTNARADHGDSMDPFSFQYITPNPSLMKNTDTQNEISQTNRNEYILWHWKSFGRTS